MPAFTAIGAYVAGTLLGLAGTAAIVVGAVVATGAAYITSRIINGNPNKGNNSAAGSQGGRIQVPPATNNKIPVVYGSAYVNGIITDARLKSLGGTTNDTMYYCLVLSEYTNNLTVNAGNFIVGQKYTISTIGTTNFTLIGAASNTVGLTFTATGTGTAGQTGQARYNSVYGLESVLWNDLRLTAVNSTTDAHKVKDGRKVVNPNNLPATLAGAFVIGKTYIITKLGTTTQANWNTIAGTSGKVYDLGAIFTCANAGTGGAGVGEAQEEDFIDTNFIVDSKSLVELRVYAGGSSAAEQIYPPQTSSNTQAAYDFWGNDDNSWTDQYAMDGLVFAIVKLTYNGDKGFTALPNVTFQLANNLANPADVWYDYMVSKRYGAGIPVADIDLTARADWANFCEEDISYTNVAGETNQSTLRYNINGVIDTSNQVKTNIDTILQNGGAWMSYNVATGLWSPIIKKANSAGQGNDVTKQFTASRSTNVLTVTAFPSGRIETGQRLYSVGGTYIGTITGQVFPLTAGETTGQKGRYTTSSTGSISTTTFYTLPGSSLEFGDDNIISGISISSTRLEDLYNKVEAEFYNRYNKDQRAYARVNLDTADRNPNEPDNQLRMSLDLVNNSMQADILGQMEMRQSRDDLVIEFTSTHYGIQTQAGDIIAVTSDLYDWAPKYFRVMRVKEIEGEDATLTAQIQALEYNPDVYTIEPITEFSTSANIGIGNLVSSRGLPKPDHPIIDDENPDAPVPYFTYLQPIPATGGPFDEIEIYFTEGWDPNSVTGTIVPGTGSNGVPVGKGLMTVTAVTYNSINPGDYFDLGGVTVEAQLTQTTISTKTYASGGAVGAKTFTLNNVTGVVIGQKPTGTGIPTGTMVIGVSGSTVTLDRAFTVQASGSYLFTTAGGTGTYRVSVSTTASGTDDLYDQPVVNDFKYLKKITPPGNASSFESGTTVSCIISELPANSNTFRRWFLKSRLGWKKNFGEFSDNQTVDLDGNVNWQPNPSGSGLPGSFGNITIGVDTLNTISTTTQQLTLTSNTGEIQLNGSTSFRNTAGTDANGFMDYDDGTLEVGAGSGIGGRILVSSTGTGTNTVAYPLLVQSYTTGTVANGFGTGIAFTTSNNENINNGTQGTIDVVMTDSTFNSNDFKFDFRLQQNSAQIATKASISSNGDLTLNGTGQFITFSTQPQGANTMYGIRGMSALDDPWFVGSGSVGNDLGYLEIATGDNTNGSASGGQIYVRQYNGQGNGGAPWYGGNGTVQNELILLDNVGNTTIPNNLTVNSGTLFVDATNNRVGINNTSPSYELHIDNGSDSVTQFAMTNNERTFILTNNAADDLLSFNYGGANRLQFNTTNQWFNSGNTGINTATPAYTLDVNGTANVETTLTVPSITTLTGDDLNITAFSGRDLTISTTLAADPVTLVRNTANISTSTRSLTLRVESTGTPAVGFSNTLEYEMETAPGTVKTIGYIDVGATSLVSGSETFEMNFGLRNGSTYTSLMNLDELGNLQIDGDLTVSGNEIKYSTGTTQITLASGGVVFAGDIQVNGNDIKSSTGATAITLSDNDVTVADRLFIVGNTIAGAGGTTAITLSGANVTVEGDLTVDSGTLKVDATNNRVGINNTSPTTDLDVTGSIKASGNIQADTIVVDDGIIKQYERVSAYDNYSETSILSNVISGTTQTTIDSWFASSGVGLRSAKYIMTFSKGSDHQCMEAMVIHDGTNSYINIYSEIRTGIDLVTIATDITGFDPMVNLKVTPTTTGSLKWAIKKEIFSLI